MIILGNDGELLSDAVGNMGEGDAAAPHPGAAHFHETGGCSMKFYCEITSWGDESLLFLDDPDANFVIIFNNNAPAELASFSVLHTPGNYNADPVVGDTMIVCDKAFTITAIGDEALQTLKELGHCTLSFKGGDTAERPGCIMLHGDVPFTKDDVKVGATIEVY